MSKLRGIPTSGSNPPISTPTLFHGLVHVMQYQKLGLSDFAARYVTGFLRGGSYEQIPLEINAYLFSSDLADSFV